MTSPACWHNHLTLFTVYFRNISNCLQQQREQFMTRNDSLLNVGFSAGMLFMCVCGKNGELGHENDQRYANYEESISQRLQCPSILLPVQLSDEPRKTGMKEKNSYLWCLCHPKCETIWQSNIFLLF